MNRYEVLLGVGVLLVAAFAGPAAAIPSDRPAAPAAQIGENRTATDDGSAAEPVAPGARFSAAVEVHQAEVDGEVENRAFGIAIARAASNESKAAAVGDRVQSLRDRLVELQDRERRLTEAYEAGEVSEARYRAEVAGIAARSEVIARQANATRDASEGLPSEALASRGVDADAIETIRRNASSMAGPEVAEIARTIGGPSVGGGLGDANRGSPWDRQSPRGRDGPGPPMTSRTDDGPNTTTTDARGRTPGRSSGPNRTAVGPPDPPESATPGPGNAPEGPPGRDPPGQSADTPRGGDGDAGDGNRGGNSGGGGAGGNNAGGGSGDRGGNDGSGQSGGRGP